MATHPPLHITRPWLLVTALAATAASAALFAAVAAASAVAVGLSWLWVMPPCALMALGATSGVVWLAGNTPPA